MKPCPHCAEEIQDAALVCKHCKLSINDPAVPKKSSKGRGLVNFLIGFFIFSIVLAILASVANLDANKVAQKYGAPLDQKLEKMGK